MNNNIIVHHKDQVIGIKGRDIKVNEILAAKELTVTKEFELKDIIYGDKLEASLLSFFLLLGYTLLGGALASTSILGIIYKIITIILI